MRSEKALIIAINAQNHSVDKPHSIKLTPRGTSQRKMVRSRFWTPLSPGGRTDPSNYWFTGKPHTKTSTCCFNHQLQQKIAVIQTLLERSDSIVTEGEDRKQEDEHIRTALHTFGNPDWAIKRVKEQMNSKKAIRKDKSKKDKAQEKSRGVVTVPCPLIHGENTTYIH